MAHYAFLDENNVVTEIIVGKDESNFDWERHYGDIRGQVCKRFSYNTKGGQHEFGGTPFRKNAAGIGHIYDEERDAFIPPQPYPSWILDDESCTWQPPIPYPNDGRIFVWSEEELNWV